MIFLIFFLAQHVRIHFVFNNNIKRQKNVYRTKRFKIRWKMKNVNGKTSIRQRTNKKWMEQKTDVQLLKWFALFEMLSQKIRFLARCSAYKSTNCTCYLQYSKYYAYDDVLALIVVNSIHFHFKAFQTIDLCILNCFDAF